MQPPTAPPPVPRGTWNVTRYPGQLRWTVHRYTDAAQLNIEWLRNSTGQAVRFRTELAAIAAAAKANQADRTCPFAAFADTVAVAP
jgi:hypothetical protein